MPGSVIAVHVSKDEAVTKGQPLVVVEAMKMEHTLTAPMDGTVTDVRVRVGQQVAVDELLVEVGAVMDLPKRVTIYEVGPRDGLQNEKGLIPVEVKAEFIRQLLAAGHTAVETTSFVSPTWVPQLADAAELLALIDAPEGVRMPVLVPNDKGLNRALDAGVKEIAVFGSATETFAQKNLNRSVAESLEMFRPVVDRAREQRPRRPRLPVDVLRRPVGGQRRPRGRGRSRPHAVRHGHHRAEPRRHDRRRHAQARSSPCWTRSGSRGSPPTSSPCTSTTPTARPWPTP